MLHRVPPWWSDCCDDMVIVNCESCGRPRLLLLVGLWVSLFVTRDARGTRNNVALARVQVLWCDALSYTLILMGLTFPRGPSVANDGNAIL
jgi:hypothetical protein